jgi:hypothetical protein
MLSVTTKGVPWKKQTWQCRSCRKQVTALRDTIFASNKLPLAVWFRILWWICSSDEPTSAYKVLSEDIQTKHGIQMSGKSTAWLDLQRIRKAMMPQNKLSGTIPLGLTHVHHLYSRRGRTTAYAAIAALPQPYGAAIATLPTLEPDAITKFALQQIASGSTIVTGSNSCFSGLAAADFIHVTEPHSDPNDPLWKPVLIKGLAENLDKYLKKVHHVQVSEQNLSDYFAEFSFRYVYGYKSVGRRFYTILKLILSSGSNFEKKLTPASNSMDICKYDG